MVHNDYIEAAFNFAPSKQKGDFIQNVNILLVENDEISLEVMSTYLKKQFHFEIATSGEQAIKMAVERHYDLILMDINLGIGMDGLKTAKYIKELDGYFEIPIIACTAFAMKGDREEFLRNGCTHYIAKPFIKRELLDMINTALSAGNL